MTPARSLAASVVALGFAGTLTGPLPAHAAPAPCERAENYAAQSGAELLRIDRLDVRTAAPERPASTSPEAAGATNRVPRPVPGSPGDPAAPDDPDPPEDPDSPDDPAPLDAPVAPDPNVDPNVDSNSLSEGNRTTGAAMLDQFVPRGANGLAHGGSGAVGSGLVGDNGADIVRAVAGRVLRGAQAGGLGPSSVGSIANADLTGIADGKAFGGSTGDRTATNGTAVGGTAGGGTAGEGGSRAMSSDADIVGRTDHDGLKLASGANTRAVGGATGKQTGDEDSGRAGDQSSGLPDSDSSQTGGDHIGGVGDENAGRVGAAGGYRTKRASLRGIGLGEARTAMVATTQIKSAAIARILDGKAGENAAWTEPILQQAPPTNERAATRGTPAGRVGPLKIGAGGVSAHARWNAGMACGNTAGEAARARASMRGASILSGRDGALVHVPGNVTSTSTTALERRGGSAHTVASATIAAGRIELAGGKVRVRVLRPPSLVATMSTGAGGEVSYRPALIEVSGEGITTRRLDTAGDHVDISLGPDRHAMESSAPGRTGLGGVGPGSALSLPEVPGLPPVGDPATESGTVAGPGTKMRISLGGMRKATRGHAIAARATAIKVTVTVTQGAATGGRGKSGYAGNAPAVSLDLAVGLLEAAAVAPDRSPASVSGAAGGLPVTGPRAVGLALGGAALVLVGAAAVVLGMRRRRTSS